MRRMVRIVASLALAAAPALLQVRCGGGGGGANPGSAPTIYLQPQNQAVTVGATATFTVTATGTPAPSYQWLLDTNVIPGAQGSSYTTPATTLAMNGGSYAVTVSNTAGKVTSAAAVLTVKPLPGAPVITAQPRSHVVTTPDPATFTVVATGSPAPSYQWNLAGAPIAGAQGPSYTTPASTSAMNAGSYTVTVTNASGTVTSAQASLTVTAPSAPVLAMQPLGQTVMPGAVATFTVLATGGPAPSYQWYLGTQALGGATSPSYTTPAATAAMNGGSYTVKVSNLSASVTSAAAVLTVLSAAPPTTVPPGNILGSGPFTSTAAAAEAPGLASGATSYPAPWPWDGALASSPARAAQASDGLTPRIVQVRDGQVIATYASFSSSSATSYTWPTATTPMDLAAYAASGGGPFGNMSHIDLFRIAQDGDTFLVYPAVYAGTLNNIFISARPDYYQDPIPHPPTDVSILGLTRNGIRPVLLDVGSAGDYASAQAPFYIAGDGAGLNAVNLLVQNLDVALDAANGSSGRSGIYINGATGLTFRQMRVHGFELQDGNTSGADGIFSTSNNNGTITLDQVELYQNGGDDGPAHNLYMNASANDPGHTVHMLHSWSHDAYYGHLFKSRVQNTILEGNYFQGGLPQGGAYLQAENYLVNIPNGGGLTMRNNILVKGASGANSNGAFITYDDEGVGDDGAASRTYAVEVVNNTFVQLARTYDGSHPLWPFFFYDHLVPGAAGFQVPVVGGGTVVPSVAIARNVFVGFYPDGTPYLDYRGDLYAALAFSELNLDFSANNPVFSTDASNAGTPAYAHEVQTGLTRQGVESGGTAYTVVGAEDE